MVLSSTDLAGREVGVMNGNSGMAGGMAPTGTTTAVDFITQLFGIAEQPVYVCSLANERDDPTEPTERHMATRDSGEVTSFVKNWDRAKRGTFICVSTLRPGVKRNKEGVAEICFLHADIDFKDVADDPATILKRLRTLPLPPSIIVHSGNGLHCYWRFKEPLVVNIVDGAETIERVEAALKLLADLVGGDIQVTQVAALMRLPGTHNSKRDEWKLVEVVDNAGHQYEFDDLETMLAETSPIVLRKLRSSATPSEANPYLVAAASLTFKPPLGVQARLAAMLYMGGDDASVHGTQVSVTASLLNAGYELEEIVATVLEATRAAAGDYGARWNWRREEKAIRGMCATWIKKRAKENATSKAKVSATAPQDDVDPVDAEDESDITRLNAIHAVLPIGNKTRVVTFGELDEFPGRETIVMTQSIGDFAALQNKYRHQYRDKKGETQSIPMGSYWIGSQHRRQYDGGMAFMPQTNKNTVGNRLNLWRGYGVNAIKPDGKSGAAGCDKFLSFMRDVICNKDEKNFDYLRKREATILQKRSRSEVALGLRTDDEGVGKGFYEKTMGHLLGTHAMQVGNPKHIIGAFNPHLETLLRLTADEALFVGNPEHRNVLFGLITEPKLTIEPKGCSLYRADSFLNLSITSNAKHFVPISGTARRFFIPTISTEHMQDFAYFAATQDQLDNGGYEALLYHFLHEVDLTDFNVRLVPKTEGLMEQRNHSLLPLEAWWVELLESGTILGSDPHAPNRAVSNEYQREVEVGTIYGATQGRFVRQLGIFDQARQIEPRLRMHISDHRLGSHLSEMGCTNKTKVMRRRGWDFPELMACRADWEKRFPGWPWRDTDITEWRAEEADDPLESANLSPDDKVKATAEAAAKAQEHANRLAKEAGLAEVDAKFR